jgi:hypothetical protein
VTDPRERLEGEGGGPGRDQSGALGHDQAGTLERLIDGVARSQPPRRAPASLEARVFAQIAARPWWSKGFAHWPVLARAAFLVASFGFIKLTLAGAIWAIDFVRTSDVAGVDALHRTGEAVSTTMSLGSLVINSIPPVWLYAGAAVGFTLYAVLFGLGTFAYRTLYIRR